MSKFTTYLHLSCYFLIAGCLWADFLDPVFILCPFGLVVCLLPHIRERQAGKNQDDAETLTQEKSSIMEDLDREARRRKEVEQLERN